jgi:hypothetical protein
MSNNPNSNKDLFLFNFPRGFIPESYEEKYKGHLLNFQKNFPTLLDYTNSNIKDISFPSLTFPYVTKTKMYGKERNFRGSKTPYDLYNRELTITMRNVDSNTSAIIMQDLLLYHYMKNDKPFIEDFIITILDEQRREQFKVRIQELIPTGISEFRLAYNEKDVEEQVYTLSFIFNYIDIEYIPKFGQDEDDSELIEEYSDQLMKNSEFDFTPPEEEEIIIGSKPIENPTCGTSGLI